MTTDTTLYATAHNPALNGMPEGCIVVEMAPDFTARIDGGPWHQPAGKHGRGGIMPKIARKLIAEGADPERRIRPFRGTTKTWRQDYPLSYWAALSVSEPDGSSVKMIPYTAMPKYWDDAEDADESGAESEKNAET